VIKKFLCVFALTAFLWTGAAISQDKKPTTADLHKEHGLDCKACHKEEPPKTAASEESCLVCHKSMEAVAERTKDFEKNPHKNHLLEVSDVACTDCHHGHSATTAICERCHMGITFEKKQETAK